MPLLELNRRRWDNDDKVEARVKTIIEPYRDVFGEKLPEGRQYWTLCGQMGDEGGIHPFCELGHMTRVGLIDPGQFHGVEGKEDTHRMNVKALQPSFEGAHLYHGLFLEVLDRELGKGLLRPGIVYLDLIQEPRGAVRELSRLLDLLNQTRGQTMLVCNMILSNWRRRTLRHTWREVVDQLEKCALFRVAIREGWEQYQGLVFTYGTATLMGTIVFVRR